ncbi:MAG TPA: CPBP family intramembrane metalloprotease [Paludibacteraceae bacterium]|nr:CPBP family intramembrane metalloprotease [Paludibacteraceae bacterium]HRS67179.1 CPBP family intramembrane metalloprotease [Paludibacteraceae bacterium]
MITARYNKVSWGIKLVLIFSGAFMGLLISSIIFLLCQKQLENLMVMKWLQLIQTTFTFVLPALALAYLFGGGVSYLKFTPIRSSFIWLCVILLMPLALPAVNYLKSLNDMIVLPHFMNGVELWMKQMELQSEVITEKFLSVTSLRALGLNLLVMAVIPALGEELFFRGVLQRVLAEKVNQNVAVWLTAFIFSAIHLQFYGFLPRFFLGALLGYLFLFSGSIWAPIVAHFINNTLAVLLFFLTFNGYLSFDIDLLGTQNTAWLGVISFILVVLFFYRLSRVKSH